MKKLVKYKQSGMQKFTAYCYSLFAELNILGIFNHKMSLVQKSKLVQKTPNLGVFTAEDV